MHRYLRAWRERGKGKQYEALIVNYADDFVILSRGHAREALAWTRWVMERIGLRLNETKTCVRDARQETFNFLGYSFGPEHYRKDGHWYLAAKPSKKSIERLKGRIAEVFQQGIVSPWEEVVASLNRILRGWANYFSYGTRLMAYRAIDNYVRTTVQNFLQRRHKVPSRGTRRFKADKIFGELGVQRLRPLHVNPIGEPDAGKRHVRFDERRPETGQLSATAPVFDSTQESTAMADMPMSTAFHSVGFLDVL